MGLGRALTVLDKQSSDVTKAGMVRVLARR